MVGWKASGPVFVISVDANDVKALGVHSFDDILQVLPLRMSAAHVVINAGSTVTPDVAIHNRAVSFAKTAFGQLSEDRLFVHQGPRAGVCVKLHAHGFSKEGLPKSIGGRWGFERFMQWIELRTRYEWDLPPGASHKGVDKIFDFSHIKQPSQLEEDERVERARRMNVLHSRRKRERERIEIEVLREQCSDLRAKNAEATATNSKLERLLAAAMVEVSRQEECGVPGHADAGLSHISNPSIASMQMPSVAAPTLRPANDLLTPNLSSLMSAGFNEIGRGRDHVGHGLGLGIAQGQLFGDVQRRDLLQQMLLGGSFQSEMAQREARIHESRLQQQLQLIELHRRLGLSSGAVSDASWLQFAALHRLRQQQNLAYLHSTGLYTLPDHPDAPGARRSDDPSSPGTNRE